jgi:hypothetical protein
MQKSMMLRWIEQAEAAQVLHAASFEQVPTPWRRRAAGDTLADWRDRLYGWLVPRPFAGGAMLQMQPARVRPSPCRRVPDDFNYHCDW